MILIVAGGITISMQSDSNLQLQIFQTYLMTLIPNIIMFIVIHFLNGKFKLKRKWNLVFFLIAATILLYVVVKDLLPADHLRQNIWGG